MQGWRVTNEDACITAADLGEHLSGLSLFGIFDGHGGKAVAAFCRRYMAVEVQRQLLCGSLVSPRSWSAAVLEGALSRAYHAMDSMLWSASHQSELQGEADETRASVVEFVAASIESDLRQGKEQGCLGKDETTLVMMKIHLLQRLETQREAQREAQRKGHHSPQSVTDIQVPLSDNLAAHVGCTALCVLFSEALLVCANAGDSRAVLWRAGRAVELSHDHRPNDRGELRRIEAAGGRIEAKGASFRVNGILNLSRAIGDLEFKQRSDLLPEQQVICCTPEITVVQRDAEDEFVVMACDGVWDVKTNEEVCQFVSERLGEYTVPEITEQLLAACMATDLKETR
eukprot:CAMPEP_0194534316 /NCGR_PEP_ID=MMETSP0253-20130528/72463_1 /TAXON_ID=2966 /ORGANISM="Noctiluca scintillans" /LENGTH=342 /DNA_ID=CAMNT_0039379967 /DNA_START=47 /DNA_END=1072 /DNA_ORIENTATION=-